MQDRDMSTYWFSFTLRDDPIDRADELYAAGCDDSLFGVSNGVPFIEFAREAESMGTAVASAVVDVQSVPGVHIENIEVNPTPEGE